MSSRLPPTPGQNWRTWALELVKYLSDRASSTAQAPSVTQLAYKKGNEKAVTSGLVMYDEATGVPVYSKNGQWLRFSDDTPL